jgi:hypothetical protein
MHLFKRFLADDGSEDVEPTPYTVYFRDLMLQPTFRLENPKTKEVLILETRDRHPPTWADDGQRVISNKKGIKYSAAKLLIICICVYCTWIEDVY